MPEKQTYLGDGIYIHVNPYYQFVLTKEDEGTGKVNTITLDPIVFQALVTYVRLWAFSEDEDDNPPPAAPRTR